MSLLKQRKVRSILGAVAAMVLTVAIVLLVTLRRKDAAVAESNLFARAVVRAGYSERITIPQPAAVAIVPRASRTNCPHQATNILDWHAGSSWRNQRVPRAGENVTLPVNSRVIIRKTVASRLGYVTIPINSTLILGETEGGIQLNVNGIDVKGSLVAGSETCLIHSPISIVLHGARPTDAVQNRRHEVYKGVSVTGTLHLHGKRFFRTWTRLASTVDPGGKVVYLQDAVNWQVGQKIVLVTTAVKDSREWHQNEVLTITKVQLAPATNVGTAVHVSSPIRYTHIANQAYQAEVGLLSRTIVIQGSAADSEPKDLDPKNCTVPEGEERYGDSSGPCGYTEITGFGGHVMIHEKGKGFVEGVEFYRMGQTNVLGRYPFHFHLLGSTCPRCYIRASSFHHSFYRCVAIHGTNGVTATENVAYDVTGYCYYLEDGVEENNTLSFNLAAHIHSIGAKPTNGDGSQELEPVTQSNRLTLPADVTASGFYITNVRNNLIGNAASGGWAGFAFPILSTPLNTFRNKKYRPSSASGLTIDGNSAHSTGWWWLHAGAFYFGGDLYYNDANVLEYNPGRSGVRSYCKVNACALGSCDHGCPIDQTTHLRVTNSKVFLTAGIGLNSWTGGMEIVGWETHDVGLSIESLAGEGFWIDKALIACRTGEKLSLPTIPEAWNRIRGDGFFWYDTSQEHIITESVFRKCGYRSDQYNQYDMSPDRGCGDEDDNGCNSQATAVGFLTHSDEFNPELMQGTRDITFEKCGRRYSLDNFMERETVSGRGQNWLDVDGSASGRGVPTFMVSAVESAKHWWTVDDNVGYDAQGPLRFVDILPRPGAPKRGLGHFRMEWDDSQHKQVGTTLCGNVNGAPCPPLGYMRHAGKRFSGQNGLAITARGDIVGPVGGYGWIVKLFDGAPRTVRFTEMEVLPETPLLVSIAYPVGTTFNVSAHAAWWCDEASTDVSCSHIYTKVSSLAQVRSGPGNRYFVDAKSGVLTLRIITLPEGYLGRPEWFLPTRTDPGEYGGFAFKRFERSGVFLPMSAYEAKIVIEANCNGSDDSAYCSGSAVDYDPNVCPSGFPHQLAYDTCCSSSTLGLANPSNKCVSAGTSW